MQLGAFKWRVVEDDIFSYYNVPDIPSPCGIDLVRVLSFQRCSSVMMKSAMYSLLVEHSVRSRVD